MAAEEAEVPLKKQRLSSRALKSKKEEGKDQKPPKVDTKQKSGKEETGVVQKDEDEADV